MSRVFWLNKLVTLYHCIGKMSYNSTGCKINSISVTYSVMSCHKVIISGEACLAATCKNRFSKHNNRQTHLLITLKEMLNQNTLRNTFFC